MACDANHLGRDVPRNERTGGIRAVAINGAAYVEDGVVVANGIDANLRVIDYYSNLPNIPLN